jgi:hypothetical protein
VRTLLDRSKSLVSDQSDKIKEDEMFISHDVVSLFTITPIPESLKVIRDRLKRDDSWRQKTELQVDDVMELLEFTLTTTYFSFRGQIYRQKFGAAMGSPVSPLVANLFMEHLEQKLLATAPEVLKPSLWKRYVDDILEVVKKDSVEKLTEFMNGLDDSGSIKFTVELEAEGTLSFLDLLIVRNAEGDVKFQEVYRKPTHTDQYLNFHSHHPMEHKLSVVRTLLDRSKSLVSDQSDKIKEDQHVKTALQCCGYPDWTFRQVRNQMESVEKKKKQQDDTSKRSLVVLPYVEKVSELVRRVLQKHKVTVAMRPFRTVRQLLVHPKDRQVKEETTECVYKIPCGNCDKSYIGETGRKFGVRLNEHRTEVEAKSARAYTRSQRVTSLTERNKSALTDHTVQQNHIIDWFESKILDRESDSLDRETRWIKEAVHIRKEGKKSMNRYEGSYSLSHVYDRVLATVPAYRGKSRKNN